MFSFTQFVEPFAPAGTSKDTLVSVYHFGPENPYGRPITVYRTKCPNSQVLDKVMSESQFMLAHPHPNLRECIDVLIETPPSSPTLVYTVLERLDFTLGGSMEKQFQYSERGLEYYSEKTLWGYLESFISVLTHLQSHGVAYRSLTPQDLFLDEKGQVKIGDLLIRKYPEIKIKHPCMSFPKDCAIERVALISGAKNFDHLNLNPYKTDMFVLGGCMALLTGLELPENFNMVKNLETIIEDFLIESQTSPQPPYSDKWMDTLRVMLNTQEVPRPDFIEFEKELRRPSKYADDKFPTPQRSYWCGKDQLPVTLKYGFRYVRGLAGQSENIPVQVDFQALRPGSDYLDFICLVDLSGSMEHERLRTVKEALNHLLTILTERDRICIIGFSNEARRFAPFLPCNDKYKPEIQRQIEELKIDDLTNILSGIKLAMEVISHRQFKRSDVWMMVFSDGTDNCGDDVLAQCVQAVREGPVDGIKINCFGVGATVGVDLLRALAGHGRGDYYEIRDLPSIQAAMREAFIQVRNVRVQIRLKEYSPAFAIHKIYKRGREFEYEIPAIMANETTIRLFELTIPKMRVEENKVFYPVALRVTYVDNCGNEVIMKPETVALVMKSVMEREPSADYEVHVNWNVTRGEEYIQEAREMQRQNNLQAAEKHLRKGAETLQKARYIREKNVAAMIETLNREADMLKSMLEKRK